MWKNTLWKKKPEKKTDRICRENPGAGAAQFIGHNKTTCGGKTPPEDDAAGNSGHHRDPSIKSGTF